MISFFLVFSFFTKGKKTKENLEKKKKKNQVQTVDIEKFFVTIALNFKQKYVRMPMEK